ncbi:TIR domain-containing protein [Chryseobacterium shandongense]|uniref:TIR domain-containing protein n=1 Tax=Chryseobacterium shandongense TaxID=1493872 RepID=A0AAD1DML8_9FLAO|nr:toll/interleukin-1 receptor domain-containing protein [Chryseobacterium shandongense]AZA88817.1 TIR domain-containing protein [Chryseobacterium shandongense]
MKIFISHSSMNKTYGEALVNLLRSIGIKEDDIIFTSNPAYGIPVGQNIFNWLRSQITENPFVIYLLSEEYYQSIACLNEMGAAWIVENKHAAIFTPDFNLSSKEFQNGALDPREIGFYIYDEERVLTFISLINDNFEITKSTLIISQSVKKFIKEINEIQIVKIPSEKPRVVKQPNRSEQTSQSSKAENKDFNNHTLKFQSLIINKKLKDEELILLHYIIDRNKFNLMTGWQETDEIDNIRQWEDINNIKPILSKNYSSILKRFEVRDFIEVSNITSYGNPKEFKVKGEIIIDLLDLNEGSKQEIQACLSRNFEDHVNQSTEW